MDAATPLPVFKSSAVRAFQSVFDSPNWGINVLWLTIAALAQSIFIGQIGLLGWGSEQLKLRAGRPENPVPDVDSNQLGDYISKGLWPFCVYFVVQIVGSLVVVGPIMLLVFIGMALVGASGGDEAAGLVMLLAFPFILMASIFLGVITAAFVIRAMVTQDFAQAFDFSWARHFVSIMFWEMVLSSIAFAFLSFGTLILGLALLCIGYLPAIGVVNGAAMNLLAQWYEVFLARGGEPVPAPFSEEPVIDATVL